MVLIDLSTNQHAQRKMLKSVVSRQDFDLDYDVPIPLY